MLFLFYTISEVYTISKEVSQLLSFSEINNKNEIELPYIEKNQVKLEFRKILDKLVINIIEANLENEILKQALLELARIERIIIVLHYLCGMDLSEIAYLLDND